MLLGECSVLARLQPIVGIVYSQQRFVICRLLKGSESSYLVGIVRIERAAGHCSSRQLARLSQSFYLVWLGEDPQQGVSVCHSQSLAHKKGSILLSIAIPAKAALLSCHRAVRVAFNGQPQAESRYSHAAMRASEGDPNADLLRAA